MGLLGGLELEKRNERLAWKLQSEEKRKMDRQRQEDKPFQRASKITLSPHLFMSPLVNFQLVCRLSKAKEAASKATSDSGEVWFGQQCLRMAIHLTIMILVVP